MPNWFELGLLFFIKKRSRWERVEKERKGENRNESNFFPHPLLLWRKQQCLLAERQPSGYSSCLQICDHKKSLSLWNTAIWEIIKQWPGGRAANLKDYAQRTLDSVWPSSEPAVSLAKTRMDQLGAHSLDCLRWRSHLHKTPAFLISTSFFPWLILSLSLVFYLFIKLWQKKDSVGGDGMWVCKGIV